MARIAYFVAGNFMDGSIPILELAAALSTLGNSIKLIGYSRSAEIPEESFVSTTAQLATEPQWWKSLNIDTVVFYTVWIPTSILQAARSAGLNVIIDADHEGTLSPRLWKGAWLRKYWDGRHSLITKLRILKLWLTDISQGRRIECDFVQKFTQVDAIKVESTTAQENVRYFLNALGRSDIGSKVQVVPFPVRKLLTEHSVQSARDTNIVVMGRLQDQQKNSELLFKAMHKILSETENFTFSILTRQSNESLAHLTAIFPDRISLTLNADRTQVARELNRSMMLLSSSRIESLPVSSLEATCMGCSIVATPLPGFIDMCTKNSFGSTAAGWSAKALFLAFKREQNLWESGERCPIEIATRARAKFSIETVSKAWHHLIADSVQTA